MSTYVSNTAGLSPTRIAASGILLTVLVCAVTVSVFCEPSVQRVVFALAGASGWFAAALLWPALSTGLRIMASVLVLTGVAAGVVGGIGFADMAERSLSRNAGILCMLIAVGFLRLVPLATVATRPTSGTRAWRETLMAMAVFGSVINISALLLIADNLRARGGGSVLAIQSLARVFTAAAAWSPFFAGMAVVVEYVPGAWVPGLMLASLPYAMIAMGLTWAWGRWGRRAEIVDFIGFPLQRSALALPALLALLVVCAFVWLPSLPIVVSIALSALVACVVFLAASFGLRAALRKMSDHAITGMASGVNELVLFLAAGVLSVGLGALFDSGVLNVPDGPYDWVFAVTALAVMMALAVVGVHPVVSVSGLAPALLTLSPSPTLLALTFLFAWSLGTSISPLSATLLTVQGRYGLPGWRVALANAPFAVVLLGVATLIFYVVDHAVVAG